MPIQLQFGLILLVVEIQLKVEHFTPSMHQYELAFIIIFFEFNLKYPLMLLFSLVELLTMSLTSIFRLANFQALPIILPVWHLDLQ